MVKIMDNDNLNQYDGGGLNNGDRGGNKNGSGSGGPGSGDNNPKKQSIFLLLIAALVTLLCMSYFMRVMTGGTEREITYNEFINMVESGEVENVEIDTDQITIYPKAEDRKSVV